MAELSITTAREAWRILRGVCCVYKPPDYALASLKRSVKAALVNDLNRLERTHETAVQQNDWEVFQSGAVVGGDYSLHPLILGDGFELDDVGVGVVNKLSRRSSGIVVLTINNSKLEHIIKDLRLPRTYRVGMKLGEATDTSFDGGKIIEKSTFDHLIGRPQILDRTLASIRASHQRGSFLSTKVDLQSQEAYELAVKGPIRPDRYGPTLIYGLKCVEYKLPNIELEITCINETQAYLAELVSELGLTLKTNAVCGHIRCIRYGFFTLDHALLMKHVNLENVLINIGSLKKLIKVNNNLKRQAANIKEAVTKV